MDAATRAERQMRGDQLAVFADRDRAKGIALAGLAREAPVGAARDALLGR
jgi:hypothetical protein